MLTACHVEENKQLKREDVIGLAELCDMEEYSVLIVF